VTGCIERESCFRRRCAGGIGVVAAAGLGREGAAVVAEAIATCITLTAAGPSIVVAGAAATS
jgi:hypothetical protein